jgi:two-component system cell cycle sensor histidine kinase/response regulator CckA
MIDPTHARILIVEDDQGVAVLERRQLERAGHQVIHVASAEEAAGALAEQHPDLLLLDYRLPSGVDGLAFLRQIREAGHDVPVILVTGFGNEALVIQAMRSGVRDFVTKTAEYLDYLPEAVARVLAQIHTEERLAESEARLAALFRGVSDAIVLADAAGRVSVLNPAAEQLLRCSSVVAAGQPLRRFLPIDPATDAQVADRQGTRADGRTFLFEGSVSAVETAGGRLYAVITRDVSERRGMESRLALVERLESIGLLAGGIAHDLNNVLAPIVLGLDLLSREALEPAQRALVETMRQSAHRGGELVRQVLTFARGSQGQRVAVRLGELIDECVSLLRRTFPPSIPITVSVAPDLWAVEAEPTRLHQVLLNLCVNARDAMPGGGRLTLTARNVEVDLATTAGNPDARPGKHVLLTVEDVGTGIPPELLPHVFDPFVTTKPEGQGTGLGLPTVKGIVRQHGGFLTVQSEVGKGTTFSTYLPAMEGPDARKPDSAQGEVPGGQGELVLVIDDEPAIRALAKAILSASSYRVLTAGDGAEGLVVYQENRDEIRLVMTDMRMPILDGPATIVALRKAGFAGPIIATSGTASDAGPVPAEMGRGAYLPKPYTPRGLLELVAELLRVKSEEGRGEE